MGRQVRSAERYGAARPLAPPSTAPPPNGDANAPSAKAIERTWHSTGSDGQGQYCPRVTDTPLHRKRALAGTDLDGNLVELQLSIAKKLYRCPGCGGSIPIGSEHVLVRVREPQGAAYHQHWHRECATEIVRGMRSVVARRPR